MEKYKHLEASDRKIIDKLHKRGEKQRKIAEIVGCSPSTISRELKRNASKRGSYFAQQAQETADERKKRFTRKRKFTDEIKKNVRNELIENQWSPKQIAGHYKKHNMPMVGKTTIYKYIHEDMDAGGDLYTHARHKLKHRNRKLYACKEKIEGKKSIDERPTIVKEKTEFGHWEIDLIVGAGNKGAILTLVEITTKMLFMKKLEEGKKAKPLADELIKMMLPYKNCIKTITCDNGSEFSDFKRVEKKLGLEFYFAHPYSSWERGLSEHTNGLVRQYIPKDTDFKDVTAEDVKKYQYKINNRPREVLDFEKPKDLFYKKAS